jgi:hypothetical protein
MKVTKKTSVGGEWAKAGENIKDGDKIKLLNGGEIVAGEYGDRHVFKILTRSKEELNLSLNQTSLNNLIDAFGDETETWGGKVVNVFVLRVMVSGKLRNVAYIAADGYSIDDDGRFHRDSEPVATASKSVPSSGDDINPDDIPF